MDNLPATIRLADFKKDDDLTEYIKRQNKDAEKRYEDLAWRINWLLKGGYLKILERSSDPAEPGEGETVIWMSDGTGKGDDGDVLIAGKAAGATKWTTLFDHSAGAAW